MPMRCPAVCGHHPKVALILLTFLRIFDIFLCIYSLHISHSIEGLGDRHIYTFVLTHFSEQELLSPCVRAFYNCIK